MTHRQRCGRGGGEVERFLKCGILAHGFVRVYCPTCKDDLLIGFSCKGRGGVGPEVNYAGYFYEVNSYGEEDAWIHAWLETRLDWMDANLADYQP
jgi:hypothetical protein